MWSLNIIAQRKWLEGIEGNGKRVLGSSLIQVHKELKETKGGNRGRGHIYPDGSKSNNTVYNATASGPELLVSEGESIKFDQPLASNPNVGGFGHGDA
ncbi:cytochrome f [Cynara cardunculus var. scolymus]|uniref:Cytochrome f n=1 Tax=Cynara cardunculus var. scolymus TaxID=59895 RepID=A0A118I5S5_CYNCS|nr:cytochrome f [Cynara cardunculus var. scolymus]